MADSIWLAADVDSVPAGDATRRELACGSSRSVLPQLRGGGKQRAKDLGFSAKYQPAGSKAHGTVQFSAPQPSIVEVKWSASL